MELRIYRYIRVKCGKGWHRRRYMGRVSAKASFLLPDGFREIINQSEGRKWPVCSLSYVMDYGDSGLLETTFRWKWVERKGKGQE